MNVSMLKETYAGKKVFLTGHTGFKGSWLLQWLKILGAQVKGFALAPENENDLYHLIGGDQQCESVIADVREKDRVVEEIIRFQPDFIFHLAAQPPSGSNTCCQGRTAAGLRTATGFCASSALIISGIILSFAQSPPPITLPARVLAIAFWCCANLVGLKYDCV